MARILRLGGQVCCGESPRTVLTALLCWSSLVGWAAGQERPIARFELDGNLQNAADSSMTGSTTGSASFARGLQGRALRLKPGAGASSVTMGSEGRPFVANRSFAVQFWVRSTAETRARMVLLAQKSYPDNSLASQKSRGWVFYTSGGTWAWNIGSGSRRVTYERDNGARMPLNDGRWHQLVMSYDHERAQVWLYYDGVNRAIYNLRDSRGFDFTTPAPLVVGWNGTEQSPRAAIVPSIRAGKVKLQALVDAFHALDVGEVRPDEFARMIVEPKRLFRDKVRERARKLGADGAAFVESKRGVDFKNVSRIEAQLMRNPYTVHQALSFMEAAPLLKLYRLVDGKVVLDEGAATAFSERERLYPSDFDIDELTVWGRALSAEEVLGSYSSRFEPVVAGLARQPGKLTTGVWNIFHGGLHFTVGQHGWDSRVAIAQILERERIDVVMMQETYSAGDFLAAELGFYFATTVDWDNLNQGANISVLSRYPIREVRVPPRSAFMNVAARVAVGDTKDAWVMSNWYGMRQFADVFDFHAQRFSQSADTPVFFGGDFNAVPHTDDGKSPASKALADAGFTDAFRSLFPDVAKFPGFTHRSGRRIDQLYFKGAGLRHASTTVIQQWPTGFPSDHYLIRSVFELPKR